MACFGGGVSPILYTFFFFEGDRHQGWRRETDEHGRAQQAPSHQASSSYMCDGVYVSVAEWRSRTLFWYPLKLNSTRCNIFFFITSFKKRSRIKNISFGSSRKRWAPGWRRHLRKTMYWMLCGPIFAWYNCVYWSSDPWNIFENMFFLCITVQPRPLFAAQALSLPLLAAPDTAGNVNIFTQKLNNFRIYRYFIFSHWGSSNITILGH